MANEKKLYRYEGPVTSFGKVITPKWTGRTFAVSEKKAKANLTYRIKKEMGFIASCKIELPGTVREE